MKKSEVFKIEFAGGGTGGHLAPGIALAEDFLLEAPCEIEFLIVGKDIEKSMLDQKHFNYKSISASPIRKSIKGIIKFLLKNIAGIFYCFFKFLFNRPNALICLGGYGSFPAAVAAKMLWIPIFVLEQNAIPGKVNRFIARWAKYTFTQWELSEYELPKKAVQRVQGNPVRQEIFAYNHLSAVKSLDLDKNKHTLLILGGSHGAKAINNFLLEHLDFVTSFDFQIIIVTGNEDFERVSKAVAEFSNIRAYPFTNEMGKLLHASDFVISRAGATTIAELTALGKPMLLVPYPYAAERHQHANAYLLTKVGAALMFDEERLDRNLWKLIIEDVIFGPMVRREMSKNSAIIGKPFAATNIVNMILDLLEEKSKKVKRWTSRRRKVWAESARAALSDTFPEEFRNNDAA